MPLLLPIPDGTSPSPPDPIAPETILRNILSPCAGLLPVVRFLFHGRGKGLRPRLLRLAARLVAPRTPSLAEAAVLVEVLHAGTLLHDDVMDHAATRRGRPTVNRLWGDGVAILAGDFLLAAVVDLALRISHPALLPIAVETLAELVEGQMMELENQGNLDLDESRAMETARKKTAALFSAACRMGASLGGGTDRQVRALGRFGENLGLAFQLLDDVRDYLCPPEDLGKERGRDLAEGKVTLPVLVAYRRGGPRERRRIRGIFADPDRIHHLAELTRLVHSLGGFSFTVHRARVQTERAASALRIFPAGREREELEGEAWRIFHACLPPSDVPWPRLSPAPVSGESP